MADAKRSLERLREKFGDLQADEMGGRWTVTVPAEKLVDVVTTLRTDAELSFEQVVDITGIDWYGREPRFEVVYQMLSMQHKQRLTLRVLAGGNEPAVPSITPVFPGADWFEREVWDMFGVRFSGHPDHRRILMPANYDRHPLRRDFPLGYEEVAFSHNAPEIHVRKPFTPEGLAAAEQRAAQSTTPILRGADSPAEPDGRSYWSQPIEPTGGMRSHVGVTLDDVAGIGSLSEPMVRSTEEMEEDPFGGTMVMNIGPHHPSTHGVLRLVTELNGEKLIRVMPDIGFLHTGIEKTMESKSYLKALPCTDRTGYASPLHCNMAYSGAIEQLLQVEVPAKAQWARVVLLELDRISSHLLFLGASSMDLGASSPFLWAVRDREKVYDIMEFVSGARMMTSYIRPGGLAYDLPQGFERAVQEYLDYLPAQLDTYQEILTENPIFLDRTQQVGVITRQQAIDLNVSGPIARAAGVDWDLRRDMPYLIYDQVNFKVPVGNDGDVYTRFMLRLEEMRESVKLAQQALDGIPPGRWMTADRKIAPPPKEEIAISMESLIHHFKIWTEGFRTPPGPSYCAIESPRGEMAFFIQSDGSAKPYRCHERSAAFANLQSMPVACEGGLVSDLIAIIASYDPILGEIDR